MAPSALAVPRLVGAIAFAGALAWLVGTGAAGCSSPSAGATPAAEASVDCPSTLAATLDQPCFQEGEVCSPTFSCPLATVTVACTCREGAFQCVDGYGYPYDAGETPSCGTPAGNLPSCPKTETTAGAAKCTQAQSGQQCIYAPQCTGGTLTYDVCTCAPDTNDDAFHFGCQNSCGGGTGPLPEAGGNPTPEAGSDGPSATDSAGVESGTGD